MSIAFYMASKTIHAKKWIALREAGHNIISTWIDEAEPGMSLDYADLARRCIAESSVADVTVLFCQPGEILKGALMEVGSALASGKEVRCVGKCDTISPVLRFHPNWTDCATLEEALTLPLRIQPVYALFAGHPYYPDEGVDDFKAFGTVEELKALYAEKADKWSSDAGGYEEPWGQIVDPKTMKVLHNAIEHTWYEAKQN